MKKELTIKNTLAEISHIEARIYNLMVTIKEKGLITGEEPNVFSPCIQGHLYDSMMSIGKAETEVKDWIDHKMLK